ncbi:MAG: CHAT domain-containing protein [Bacteroidia bacterium]|nr:CHAT domain-containing protein [Bacteroidia bacterium]
MIWQPLEKYLDGVKDIYYSPGGLLHTISFSAIANDKNTLLCDAYHIEQQSSTSNIGTKTENDIAQDLTVGLFGGIEYSGDSSNFKLWSYLEGTKNEVDHISKTFASDKSKTIYLTGAAASEEKLKKIALQCDILHISTHGFFFPEPDILSLSNSERGNDSISSRRYEQLGTRGYGVWTYIMNKNPLMRSGLVFAGANNVWNDEFLSMENDGVLTAQEVTQMDLRKVKLVVLSACETGLGDIKGSEGVYGLQRAFKIAGVNYLIMSLWQIPDKETEEFMTVFYSKLLEKQNIQTAFTLTQKELSNKYDPYYWAAFVLLR